MAPLHVFTFLLLQGQRIFFSFFFIFFVESVVTAFAGSIVVVEPIHLANDFGFVNVVDDFNAGTNNVPLT